MSTLSSPNLLPDHPVISQLPLLISAEIAAETWSNDKQTKEKVKTGISLQSLAPSCYCRAVIDLAEAKSGLARLLYWSRLTESKYE